MTFEVSAESYGRFMGRFARPLAAAFDVRLAGAEELPIPDGTCDLVLAQLVVLFMSDPVRGIGEMARCARPGGLVAANVWDHGGGTGPLSPFWAAARSLDPASPDESHLPGVHEGQLTDLFEAARLTDVTSTALTVRVDHPTFDDWWDPFTLSVGPAGAYVDSLDPARRGALRDRCRDLLPRAPFHTDATAWVAFART